MVAPHPRPRRRVVHLLLLLTLLTLNIPGLQAASRLGGGTTVIVNAANPNWALMHDAPSSGSDASGSFVLGPGTAPLGLGSVQLRTINTNGGYIAVTTAHTNTLLSDIDALSYATRRTLPSTSSPLAISLAFNIDFDLTDSTTNWQGRLTFEPYMGAPAGTVQPGVWQTWDTINGPAGRWWLSNTTIAPTTACRQASPCTITQLLANWPNMGVHATLGGMLLKAGRGWSGTFEGQADALTLVVNGVSVTYDFEPTPQCTTTCYVDGTNGNNANGGTSPADAKRTIQAALTQVSTGGEVIVAPGTYNEDLSMTKANVTLRSSAGPEATIISGVLGGGGNTIAMTAHGTQVDGFTITRVTGTGENSIGLSNLTSGTGQAVRNSIFLGNRTAIYLNPSTGFSLTNSVLADNRTGVLFAPGGSGHTNNLIANNRIVNNRTFGVLVLESVPAMNGTRITNNDISGNWASQLEHDGAGVLDASGNWWGADPPPLDAINVNTLLGADPGTWGYPGPVAQPGAPFPYTLSGIAANQIDATPWLDNATDTDGARGFQGDFSYLHVGAFGAQAGITTRIQEALDSVLIGGRVEVDAGSYNFIDPYQINKSLTLISRAETYDVIPPEQTTIAGSAVDGGTIIIAADDVTIQGFVFTQAAAQATDGYIQFTGPMLLGSTITANHFDGLQSAAIDSGTTMLGGLEISANRFDDIAAGAAGSAIKLSGGLSSMQGTNIIATNDIATTEGAGVEIAATMGATGAVVIRDNVLTATNELQTSDSGAIQLDPALAGSVAITCNQFVGGFNGVAFADGAAVSTVSTIQRNSFAVTAGVDLYGGDTGGATQDARYNYSGGTIPSVGGADIFTVESFLANPPACGIAIVALPESLELAEGGTDVTYELWLASAPSAPVAIDISANDGQSLISLDGTTFVSATTVMIPVKDWNLAQTITVRAVDDNLVEGTPHLGELVHTVAPTSAVEYLDAAPVTVTLNIADNDTAGAVIVESGDTTAVAEEGTTTDTYSVTLTAEPTSPVTITVEANGQTLVSAAGGPFAASAELVFTPEDWDAAQTVTVQAIDDNLIEGPHSDQLDHSAASADPNFDGIAIDPVSVSITDNDTAGAVIVESGGITAVAEEGPTSDTYTVTLTAEPTSPVTITVSVSASQTLVSAGGPFAASAELVFTPANWDVAQTVTVQAIDDSIDEGPHSDQLDHSAASADPDFDGIAIDPVSVSITDNDSAGVSILPLSIETAEDGSLTGTYSVTLNTEPTAPVTVTASHADGQLVLNAGGPSGSSVELVFTPANWDSAQLVSVSAIDDTIVEGPHSGLITHSVTSADPLYDGSAASDVTATITDNDSAGVSIVESGDTTAVAEEGQTTDTYTVVLNAEPTSPVTITISVSDGQTLVSAGGAFATSVELVFTPENWDSAQEVTVQAVDDALLETTPHFGLIAHAVAPGSAPGYEALEIADLSVSISDNERTMIYLPYVVKSATVDLSAAINIEPAQSSFTAGQPVTLTVTVTNNGNMAAGSFWVDFFINPNLPPQAANQIWNDRCAIAPCFGLVWNIDSLAPGASVTLSSADFNQAYSLWPGWLASGSRDLYAYIDSWNPGEPNGAIAETNEANNLAALTGLSVTGPNPAFQRPTSPLPQRPLRASATIQP